MICLMIDYDLKGSTSSRCLFFLIRFNSILSPMARPEGGESVADNCQILQTRVNRYKSDKEQVDKTELKGYSCELEFTDKELDIIEMAVYGDVIRPGNQCRCRTMAEMLGQYKPKDRVAACKIPRSNESS
ncbi:hypothetical protein SAY86_006895 [Trapa natans]|uniref:Uncharacterized protein n=1 Tax=Trapa natans TaxID=22666 RepID=A0AAN7L4C0_TRANT|nr:hypothetical protein SAY86_006895 [Trapa natans]